MSIVTGRNRLQLDISPDLYEDIMAYYSKDEQKRWCGYCEQELALSISGALYERLADGRQYIVKLGPLEWSHYGLRREVTLVLRNWRDAKEGEAADGAPFGESITIERKDRVTAVQYAGEGLRIEITFVREGDYWRRIPNNWRHLEPHPVVRGLT